MQTSPAGRGAVSQDPGPTSLGAFPAPTDVARLDATANELSELIDAQLDRAVGDGCLSWSLVSAQNSGDDKCRQSPMLIVGS